MHDVAHGVPDTRTAAVRRSARLIVVVGLLACGGSDPNGSGADAAGDLPEEGVYGTAPVARGGVPSVVSLTPLESTEGPGTADATERRIADEGLIDQFGLTFSPRLLLVSTGATVTFTNSESALTHNVHLRWIDGDSTIFNGDAATGESIRVTLTEEGGYDVLCDVHPGMTAFVFVTSAPFAALADDDGAFRIGSVPAGDYAVFLWTADAGSVPAGTVTVGTGATEVRPTPTG